MPTHRPPKQRFTTAQIIKALQETKGLQWLAAKRLGCHPKTIAKYNKRYPEIGEAIEDAKKEMVDIAEAQLFQAVMRGELRAIEFYLRTQGKERGYVESINVDLDAEITKLIAQIIELKNDHRDAGDS